MGCPTNSTSGSSANCTNPFPTADDARNNPACKAVVFAEICAIQKQLLEAISSCQTSVIIDSGTPLTTVQGIESVTVIDGGENNQPVEPQVIFNHPTGAGAVGVPTIVNGRVTAITITAGGSGYQPKVAITLGTLVGDGNAVFQTIVNNSGVITAVNPLIPGTGYSYNDELTVTHPNGFGAVVKVVQVGLNGEVVSTVVESGGTGYQPVLATVTVDAPTGVGFSGLVAVNGSGIITNVSVIAQGMGYLTQYPRLTVNTLTGSGATFSFEIDDGTGEITAINVITPGTGYQSTDTITILAPIGSPDGTGATAELVLSEPSPYDAIGYWLVWTGQVQNSIYSKNLQAIVDYFQCLGYSIQIITNPLTGATIAWKISW